MLYSKILLFLDLFILLYNQDQITDPDLSCPTFIPLKSMDYFPLKQYKKLPE